MQKHKKLIRLSLALGLLSLIGLFLAALALNDIGKGLESDLSGEWMVVRFSFLFIFLFTMLSIITLWKLAQRHRPDH